MKHSLGMLLALLFLIGIVLSSLTNAVAQNQLPQGNLAELKLKVGRMEVIESISRADELRSTKITLSPKEGRKLAVVTLQGMAPRACMLTIKSNSFVAVVESEVIGKNGKKSRSTSDAVSAAVTSQPDFLGFDLPSSLGEVIVGRSYFNEPGPVTLRVLFTVPKDIVSIRVNGVEGIAKVPKQSRSK